MITHYQTIGIVDGQGSSEVERYNISNKKREI